MSCSERDDAAAARVAVSDNPDGGQLQDLSINPQPDGGGQFGPDTCPASANIGSAYLCSAGGVGVCAVDGLLYGCTRERCPRGGRMGDPHACCGGGTGVCDASGYLAGCPPVPSEMCNGLDDNCDGLTDDEPTPPVLGPPCTTSADCSSPDLTCDGGHCTSHESPVMCNDRINCTFDLCTSFLLGPAHCSNAPKDYRCDELPTCEVGICDPTGATPVPAPPDTIIPEMVPAVGVAWSGCRRVVRNSWCADVWDGCACNGIETCRPALVIDPANPSGCTLHPQPWFDPGTACDPVHPGTPVMPCATTPCNNCNQRFCCERSGNTTCNRSHLGSSGLPEVLTWCAAHPEFTEFGPFCVPTPGHPLGNVCPADGNACTIEACASATIGCTETNVPPGATTRMEAIFLPDPHPSSTGPPATHYRCQHEVSGTQGCTTRVCVGPDGAVGLGVPLSVCTPVIHGHSESCPRWDQGCATHDCVPLGQPPDSSAAGSCGYFPSTAVARLCDDGRPCTVDSCDAALAAQPFVHHIASNIGCEHDGVDISMCPVLDPDDPTVRTQGCFQERCLREGVPLPTGWYPATGPGSLGCVFEPHDELCAGHDDGLSCTESICSRFTPASPDGPPTLSGSSCWNVPHNRACVSAADGGTAFEERDADGGVLCRFPTCSAVGNPGDPLAIPLSQPGCYLDQTVHNVCLH